MRVAKCTLCRRLFDAVPALDRGTIELNERFSVWVCKDCQRGLCEEKRQAEGVANPDRKLT